MTTHYTSWLIRFPILWAIIIPSKPGRIIPFFAINEPGYFVHGSTVLLFSSFVVPAFLFSFLSTHSHSSENIFQRKPIALNFAKGPKREKMNKVNIWECWETFVGPLILGKGIVDQHLGFRTNDSHSERAKRGAELPGAEMLEYWCNSSGHRKVWHIYIYNIYIYISYMWEVVPCS